jgi:hypothetical protein
MADYNRNILGINAIPADTQSRVEYPSLSNILIVISSITFIVMEMLCTEANNASPRSTARFLYTSNEG